jgi:hypothetical protein
LVFWLIFISIFINSFNFIKIIFLSELIWVILYTYTIILSGFTDDITLLTLSFLILGLAGLEFSFGYILIIVFNFFNKSIYLDNNKTKPIQRVENYFNANIKKYTSIF